MLGLGGWTEVVCDALEHRFAAGQSHAAIKLMDEMLMLRKIVDQSAEMRARLDDYLADAETLAKEFQRRVNLLYRLI